MLAYIACGMMTWNQVVTYRHLLQFIQEELRRQDQPAMIMWLYDMKVRLHLANRSEYDTVSLASLKQAKFRYKDQQIMAEKQATICPCTRKYGHGCRKFTYAYIVCHLNHNGN